jgi:hypothetical protein
VLEDNSLDTQLERCLSTWGSSLLEKWDLLVFLHCHQKSLLTVEQISSLLGHDRSTVSQASLEVENSFRRCMTIVKARGSQHEFDSREYRMGKGGILLQPAEENAALKRPFSAYSSILSRAPTRFPAVVAADAPPDGKTFKPS